MSAGEHGVIGGAAECAPGVLRKTPRETRLRCSLSAMAGTQRDGETVWYRASVTETKCKEQGTQKGTIRGDRGHWDRRN